MLFPVSLDISPICGVTTTLFPRNVICSSTDMLSASASKSLFLSVLSAIYLTYFNAISHLESPGPIHIASDHMTDASGSKNSPSLYISRRHSTLLLRTIFLLSLCVISFTSPAPILYAACDARTAAPPYCFGRPPPCHGPPGARRTAGAGAGRPRQAG